MTLTFGYFQYYPDMIFIMLPVFLSEIVPILLNIMIYRSGRAEKEMQKQKIRTFTKEKYTKREVSENKKIISLYSNNTNYNWINPNILLVYLL